MTLYRTRSQEIANEKRKRKLAEERETQRATDSMKRRNHILCLYPRCPGTVLNKEGLCARHQAEYKKWKAARSPQP